MQKETDSAPASVLGLPNRVAPLDLPGFSRSVGLQYKVWRKNSCTWRHLVSRRYERGSIIITSNQSLGAQGEVFGGKVIASVILFTLKISNLYNL